MARNAQNQAQSTYKQDTALTKGSEANANSIYGQLMPAYTQEATNPQGYGTSTLAKMDTANQQSAGGALGAATGKAAQYAAANRNAGGFAPVLDEASRASNRNLGEATLATNLDNAKLKEVQRQQGLSGLQGMYGTQNADVLASLGLQDQATNALTQAQGQGWVQQTADILKALNGAGYSKGAGGAYSVSG